MSNQYPSLSSTLNQWLAETHGFVYGNPFATLAADQERLLLPKFYVDVDGYERIKEPHSIVVFAPRGGGKSALRLVLADQSFPLTPTATSLAVEFTDFDPLISQYQVQKLITIKDYTDQLLRVGARSLFNALCPDPAETLASSIATLVHQIRLARISDIKVPVRVRLASLFHSYCPALLAPAALYERLHNLNPDFQPDWGEFHTCVTQHQLRQLVVTSPLSSNHIAKLLADLNDYLDTQSHQQATPREQVENFINLVHLAGFSFTQILIDRLDENVDTADNPELQATIIEPLLANLPILEIPDLAFKFFLSRETRDILINRPKIRRDRLTDYAVTILWDIPRLKRMLNERLSVYSEGRVQELTQLFQFQEYDGRPVGEWVESDMLHLAQGSPRRLLLAGHLLLEACITRTESPELLEAVDWEMAKVELMKRMPPILRLNMLERIAWLGDRAIPLTSQQHRILITLATAGGQCNREDLIQTVWETDQGVTDAAVDRAINRLREVLGDNPDMQLYLATLRGEGFKLKNYEVDGI